MNKISKLDRPDYKQSTLQPISFPNIHHLQASNTSASSHHSQSLPIQSSNKHHNYNIPLIQPDLFQYNDISPLMLSSDEQEQPEPTYHSQQYKQIKIINRYSSPSIDHSFSKPKQQDKCIVLIKIESQQDLEVKFKEQNKSIKSNTKKKEEDYKSPIQVIKQNLAAKELLAKQQDKKKDSQVIKKNATQNKEQDAGSHSKSEQILLEKTFVKNSHVKKVNDNKMNASATYYIKNEQKQVVEDKIIHIIQENSNEETQKSKEGRHQNDQYPQQKVNLNHMSLNLSKFQEKQVQNRSNTSQIMNQVKQENSIHTVHIQEIQTERLNEQDRNFKKNLSAAYTRNPHEQTPVRKKRNRIFDTSSIRNKSTIRQLTPSRGPQINHFQSSMHQDKRTQKDNKERDHFPQIKALNVLDKIVDQLAENNEANRLKQKNPQLYEELSSLKSRLQNYASKVQKSVSLQSLLEEPLQKERLYIEEQLLLHKKLLDSFKQSQKYYKTQLSLQKQLINLHEEFTSINSTVEYYKQTKYRLIELQKTIRSLYILMFRRQYRQLYEIFKELSSSMERMKEIRLTLGNSKIQKRLHEYLSNEIRQLTEVQSQNRQKLQVQMNISDKS